MIRRLFLRLAGGALLVALTYHISSILEFARRIQGRFIKPAKLPPSHQRKKILLNPEGYAVPLELALNSRCTSDYNGRQDIFHWGLFDTKRRLAPQQIQALIEQAHIPRFTDGRLSIEAREELLYFLMADEADEEKRAWMMIESGMQQQVVCLLSAAFGVGMVFKGLGMDGTRLSDTMHGNVRMKLDAMHPSYDGSYWSDSVPEGMRSWRQGNLPAPDRKGKTALVQLVAGVKNESSDSCRSATIYDVGQLLWAGRGRTPHYYKSKPWGMTIPVAGGGQDFTRIVLLHAEKLFRYSNWEGGRPTHHLEKMDDVKAMPFSSSEESGESNKNCHIIICRNEKSARAHWETGYQLINIVLQAKSLGLRFSAEMVNQSMAKKLQEMNINNANCIVSMPYEVDATSNYIAL